MNDDHDDYDDYDDDDGLDWVGIIIACALSAIGWGVVAIAWNVLWRLYLWWF